ncbi:MAG: protein kinase [Chloroflexota bacterium]|nr:protein kinase [Chloroflexota bacterium]
MLQPEQQVGPYRIIQQIGQGGMATVYKARHERLDRFVAVKVMHQAFVEDPTFHARFEREAKIIAALEHPNIVPVHDFAEVAGQPYLIMKYIEGRTLKQTLIKQALSLADILRIMTPIADALDYAHRMGVLHRDIKPSNIIIAPSGTPYLTDFGMARIAQAGESTISADMMLGTPQYISPEQALGRTTLDARTDLYSLGVVLYELIVGQVPYSGDTPYSVIHDHIYRPLPQPSAVNAQVTPAVEAVLVKALEKDPAKRYASAGEMMGALQAAIDASGLHELDPNRRERAAESLARLRGQEIPPPVAIPAPIPNVNVGTRHASSVPATTSPTTSPQPPGRKVEFSLDLGSNEFQGELRKAGQEIQKAFKEAEKEIRDAFADETGSKKKSRSESWDWSSSEEHKDDDDNADMPASEEAYIRRRVEKRIEARNSFLGHLGAYIGVNAVLWMVFIFNGGLEGFMSAGGDFPWPMLVSLFWGAGFAAHAVETWFATGERAKSRDRIVRTAMREEYGTNWYKIANKKQFKEVRRRVLKTRNEVQEFFSHLAVYLMVNGGLWSIFLSSGGFEDGGDFPWPMFVTLFWGIGLVANAIGVWGSKRNEVAIERAYARELESESLLEEKAKRKNSEIRLTEDGELTDSMVAEIEAQDKPKRQLR